MTQILYCGLVLISLLLGKVGFVPKSYLELITRKEGRQFQNNFMGAPLVQPGPSFRWSVKQKQICIGESKSQNVDESTLIKQYVDTLREAFKKKKKKVKIFCCWGGGGQDRSPLHFFFSSKTWSKMA